MDIFKKYILIVILLFSFLIKIENNIEGQPFQIIVEPKIFKLGFNRYLNLTIKNPQKNTINELDVSLPRFFKLLDKKDGNIIITINNEQRTATIRNESEDEEYVILHITFKKKIRKDVYITIENITVIHPSLINENIPRKIIVKIHYKYTSSIPVECKIRLRLPDIEFELKDFTPKGITILIKNNGNGSLRPPFRLEVNKLKRKPPNNPLLPNRPCPHFIPFNLSEIIGKNITISLVSYYGKEKLYSVNRTLNMPYIKLDLELRKVEGKKFKIILHINSNVNEIIPNKKIRCNSTILTISSGNIKIRDKVEIDGKKYEKRCNNLIVFPREISYTIELLEESIKEMHVKVSFMGIIYEEDLNIEEARREVIMTMSIKESFFPYVYTIEIHTSEDIGLKEIPIYVGRYSVNATVNGKTTIFLWKEMFWPILQYKSISIKPEYEISKYYIKLQPSKPIKIYCGIFTPLLISLLVLIFSVIYRLKISLIKEVKEISKPLPIKIPEEKEEEEEEEIELA